MLIKSITYVIELFTNDSPGQMSAWQMLHKDNLSCCEAAPEKPLIPYLRKFLFKNQQIIKTVIHWITNFKTANPVS